MIRFGPLREGHEDRAHVEQTKCETNAVSVEVSNYGYDVTGLDSLESRIVELCRFFYLREAQRFARTNEKGSLAVRLTAGEIVEQSSHSYAPPT